MKKYILFPFALLLSFYSHAQLIDNKLNISVGVFSGQFQGEKLIKEGSFISPALYPNYETVEGGFVKSVFKKHRFFSLGFSMNYLQASDWSALDYSDYSNSSVQQYSLSPVVQLHNSFAETGIRNRFKLYIEVAPSLGLAALRLTEPLFYIQKRNASVPPPMESSDLLVGITGSAGVEFAFSKALGTFVAYSLQHNWVKSKLYHDKAIANTQVSAGLIMRFKQEKRFYY